MALYLHYGLAYGSAEELGPSMSIDDWYRNKDWNPETEAKFFTKLRRARRKGQYLRIQASYLTERRPEIALRLLEQYFSLGDDFDLALAYMHQGTAYRCIGRIEDAIRSLERALLREKDFPRLKTQAWSEFAMLVATEKLEGCYSNALKVLSEN